MPICDSGRTSSPRVILQARCEKTRKFLAGFPQTPPGDIALFNMGLIYVHYANPKRDTGLARVFFARLEKEFPDSPRRMEAKVWSNILETMENEKRQGLEVEEKKRTAEGAGQPPSSTRTASPHPG